MQALGDPRTRHPASKAPWQGHPGREGPCTVGGGDPLKAFSRWRNTPFSHWTMLCVCVRTLSHVKVFATPRTETYQAPLSMGFSGKNTGVEKIPFSRGSSQPREGEGLLH